MRRSTVEYSISDGQPTLSHFLYYSDYRANDKFPLGESRFANALESTPIIQ